MNEVQSAIKQEILENENQKIVKGESIEEYFNSFNKNCLLQLLASSYILNNEYNHELLTLKNKSKKVLIEKILERLDNIIYTLMKFLRDDFVTNLSSKNIFPLREIEIAKRFALAKVEYNKKNDSYKLYIPKEINILLKKYDIDKEILAKKNNYRIVLSNLLKIVDAYGIIDYEELLKIYNKYYKVELDIPLEELIENYMFLDEGIAKFRNGIHNIVCNYGFSDVDEAWYFYKTQEGKYHEFTKKELDDISSGNYIKNMKEYKEFANYLTFNFEGIEEDLDNIFDFYVQDYMFSAQVDGDRADDNFMKKIPMSFAVNVDTKYEMLKMVRKIFDKYPKWVKRGNI